MARLILTTSVIWLFLSLGTSAIAQSQSTSSMHPDSLAKTHILGCIPLEEVSNVHTPADLSGAVVRCAKRGRFEQAIQLFFVYSAYGYYDQARMLDHSAGSAIGALNSEMFQNMSAQQREGMGKAAEKLQDRSGSFFNDTCELVGKIGPPNYVPLYMAAHGLKAFKFVGDEIEFLTRLELSKLIKHVDAERLWDESLHEVNRCPS
ncbi:MAG: hypothetical protein AAF830_17375 [Pseudomonadota bacterium]